MKLTWKKKNKEKKRPLEAISEDEEKLGALDQHKSQLPASATKLADSFQAQGNKLAEDGKYREALGKWEAALTLMPASAVIHEQKAQLLEIGDAWIALKAATLPHQQPSDVVWRSPTWLWLSVNRAYISRVNRGLNLCENRFSLWGGKVGQRFSERERRSNSRW
ncbi:hypothetical protein UlMin_035917 [Ulmus minor]